MFPHIKTSKANREVVAKLTQRLNLGTENMISRIALVYSLSKDRILNLKDLKDSGGKEYAQQVLLGNEADYYLGMLALHYQIHINNPDMPKYVKLHVDDGLSLIDEMLSNQQNIEGFDFLVELIGQGIAQLKE